MRVDAGSGLSLEAMAADPGAIDHDRVAREFEAMLLARVWKSASQSLGFSKLLDGGSAGRMYRELLIDEVARRAALGRGLGLAGEVSAQLSVQAEAERTRAEAERVRAEAGSAPAAEEGRSGD